MSAPDSIQTLVTKSWLTHPLQSPSDLPATFPDVETPRFLYGDCLQWMSNGKPADWGIVIGRFYSFAAHCNSWQWCYLILLDPGSPSSTWVRADIAWEDDLQAFNRASVDVPVQS